MALRSGRSCRRSLHLLARRSPPRLLDSLRACQYELSQQRQRQQQQHRQQTRGLRTKPDLSLFLPVQHWSRHGRTCSRRNSSSCQMGSADSFVLRKDMPRSLLKSPPSPQTPPPSASVAVPGLGPASSSTSSVAAALLVAGAVATASPSPATAAAAGAAVGDATTKSLEAGPVGARRAQRRSLRRGLRLLGRLVWLSLRWTPVAVSLPVVVAVSKLGLPGAAGLTDAWWSAVLRAVEGSGPTHIKFMQWASTRRDLFPAALCTRFSVLHSEVRPRPWHHTARTLSRAFGDDWMKSLTLARTPVGCGCVAQVYEGELRTQGGATREEGMEGGGGRKGRKGRKVAVKVIHEHVKECISLDLSLMRQSCAWLEWAVPGLAWLGLKESVEEFSVLMSEQTDLVREASHLRTFAHNFKGVQDVRFPVPVEGWVSTNALVESFEEGTPISAYLQPKEQEKEERGVAVGDTETAAVGDTAERVAFNRKLAGVGLQALLKMAFQDNFLHGDLHPGNILVSAERTPQGGPVLIFLDVGISISLSAADFANFTDLFYAIAGGKGPTPGRLILERARNQRCTDPDAFCAEVDKLVLQARNDSSQHKSVHVAELIGSMLSLCYRHSVQLESRFAGVVLAMAVLEGVGRSLDDDQDLLQAAKVVLVKRKLGSLLG